MAWLNSTGWLFCMVGVAAVAVGVACANGPGVCGCAGGERGDGY